MAKKTRIERNRFPMTDPWHWYFTYIDPITINHSWQIHQSHGSIMGNLQAMGLIQRQWWESWKALRIQIRDSNHPYPHQVWLENFWKTTLVENHHILSKLIFGRWNVLFKWSLFQGTFVHFRRGKWQKMLEWHGFPWNTNRDLGMFFFKPRHFTWREAMLAWKSQCSC